MSGPERSAGALTNGLSAGERCRSGAPTGSSVLVATTPTAPAAPAAVSRRAAKPGLVAPAADAQTRKASTAPRLAATACEGSSLTPPLAGTLEVTSEFGLRQHSITKEWKGHGGTDLHAASGTPVNAMADGVVDYVGNNVKTVKGKTVGHGWHVILLHPDGSRTLYGHLQAGTLPAKGTKVTAGSMIAKSDASGGVTAPHLHIQYAPDGKIHKKDSLIDAMPCIGANVGGSITVRDNGNLADDAFSVSIDGRVVCTTTIGESNTCTAGNLRPGSKTLVLTALVAPDNAGTFEITLSDGLTFDGGGTQVSGVIAQGATASYTIVVPNSP